MEWRTALDLPGRAARIAIRPLVYHGSRNPWPETVGAVQGNRILLSEHLEEVIAVPSGPLALGCDAPL